MLIVGSAAACQSRGQQTLRQNDAGAQSRTIGAVPAFTNTVEAIAGSDYPGIGCGTLQILAEVFENRGIFGRYRGKVVEGLVNAGRQTGSGYVVAEDAAIDDLAEEGRARYELTKKVLDIVLAIRREGFIV